MRQESFVAAREERWRLFAQWLEAREARPVARPDASRATQAPSEFDLPGEYRRLCQDLALARDRAFAPALVERLSALVLRGHQALYGAQPRPSNPVPFLLHRFPRAVRRERWLVLAASLLFYGSGLLFYLLDLYTPDLVHYFMGPEQVAQIEEMYDPAAEHYGTPRDAAGDFSMFAYYVNNNIGIAFRTFASGIFFGLGSLLLVVFNGVFIGLVAGHITNVGYGETFFPFVIGHGSFELTAIVLAGVAGLRLGWSLVAPGPWSRGQALQLAAHSAVPIVYGFAFMLLVAAVIEAFWSSSTAIPIWGKLLVGTGFWALVAAWLTLGGRGHAD